MAPWRSADVFHGPQVTIAVIDFGRQAHADGSSGVVARVVETSWTGGAARDVVRQRARGAGRMLDYVDAVSLRGWGPVYS